MNSVSIIEVIRTRLKVRGQGTPNDPVRLVTQYWFKDGNLLLEEDEERESILQSQVIELRAACRAAERELLILNGKPSTLAQLREVLR